MISVGIDVSKEKSMVFAADENGEVLLKPCEFEHTESGMNRFNQNFTTYCSE